MANSSDSEGLRSAGVSACAVSSSGQNKPVPNGGHRLPVWFSGNDADQPAVLFVAFEVVVAESDDLTPRHQRGEADRRTIEVDPRRPVRHFSGFGMSISIASDGTGFAGHLSQTRRQLSSTSRRALGS